MSQLYVDNIKNRTGGAIGAPSGAVVTGVATATQFSGNVTGVAATFTGNVSVGGVLTYEDVTNVDSVGIVTARSGIEFGASGVGGTITATGQAEFAGVCTAASFSGNITGTASNASAATGDFSIADKIIHTGDTNTAIRFPAADTFTVETAGSEAARFDSSQRLLLGTSTSPTAGQGLNARLVIQGYAPSTPQGGGYMSLQRGQAATAFGANNQLGLINFGDNTGASFAGIECYSDAASAANDFPGRLVFSTTADGASTTTERLRITSAGAAIFKGGLAEKYENAGTTLGAQTDNPLSDGNVILFTGNESGNTTINFTGVHATISNGETVSFTVILTPNNSGVINVVQVDGQAITIKWSGGSAPSAGSSGQDIYTFQILKTGTGTSDYTVFGAAANYA
jgi:hypothetical protein